MDNFVLAVLILCGLALIISLLWPHDAPQVSMKKRYVAYYIEPTGRMVYMAHDAGRGWYYTDLISAAHRFDTMEAAFRVLPSFDGSDNMSERIGTKLVYQ